MSKEGRFFRKAPDRQSRKDLVDVYRDMLKLMGRARVRSSRSTIREARRDVLAKRQAVLNRDYRRMRRLGVIG